MLAETMTNSIIKLSKVSYSNKSSTLGKNISTARIETDKKYFEDQILPEIDNINSYVKENYTKYKTLDDDSKYIQYQKSSMKIKKKKMFQK